MSEGSEGSEATLHLAWADHAPKKLSARIEEFKRRNARVELDDRVAAIQFLRGTAGRASFVLPALYLALGARSLPQSSGGSHWQAVQAVAFEQSSLQTIALTCRSIFDDSRTRLSGKRIANLSDQTLTSVAMYWASRAGRSIDDASKALILLRKLFERCAQPEKILLDKPSLLERRVGLLKYYAHRQAAHITLEDYLFDTLDLVHVAAAIVIIGAVIVDFDDPSHGPNYFDSIDLGGWEAAKQVFPDLPIDRIFKSWDIQKQAALNWKIPQLDGVDYILNQLPSAIGYWDSSRESE